MTSGKKPEPFNTSMDARNSRGVAAIHGNMRGSIVAAAEDVPLTDRFLLTQHAHLPAMIIYDNETGRSSTVALCNYRGVRQALQDLFGPPKLTPQEQLQEMGLPLVMELEEMRAIGGASPYEEEPAYRLEIDGIQAGELGVGRIQIRDGLFHVISTEAWIGEFSDLDEAMEVACDRILPLHRGAGYR